jgi:hypothetical protein
MNRTSLSGSLSVLFGLVALAGSAHAGLIAGWDYQTTTSGGTAVTTWNATTFPKVFNANVGLGTLYLDGTNGSSDWNLTAASTTTELNAFTGTAVNSGSGLTSVTTSPAALALVNQTANNKSAVFAFNMAGFTDLTVSYASQRTATGFNTQQWDYSTDGLAWNPLATQTAIASSFGLISLPTTTALDNAATSFLRLTVSGATSGSGNNRLDNIQFNATPAAPAVPEPGTLGLLASGLMPAGILLRRRRK